MPFGYLVSTALMAVCTFFALRAPRRPRRLAMVSFALGLVLNELPFVAALVLLASTALAFGDGDVDSVGAWLVVGLAGCTLVGLLAVVRRSLRAPGGQLPWARILFAPFPIRPRSVVRVADLSYGPAGRRNLLDVYHHRSQPSRGPVLVFAHGGHFRSGRKNREARPLLHRLAREGWVCISLNYRLQPSAHFPDFHDDFNSVVGWAHKHAQEYGADSSVLFVAGSSAGAHMAAMAALRDPSIAGALCFYGYYGQVDRTAASTPASYVEPDAPPFFLAHGTHDTLVPVESAREFVSLLRRTSNSEVTYLELPGAQHSFDLFHSIRNERMVEAAVAFGWRVIAAR